MLLNKVTLLSMNELAKELGLNKSKLSYYVSMGLIKPANTIGRMMIFEKETTVVIIKKIEKWRKNKLSLKEIKEKI